MAVYEVHKSADNDFSIKVVTPTGTDITIKADMTTKKLTVTIPKGTKMGIGTSVGDSGKYFHFNYFSFITVEFNNGTTIPASSTIKTLFKPGSGVDNSSYYPSLSEFKKFSNNVIIFHYGADTSNGYECPSNWYHELASEKKIVVSIPDGASSFNAYVGGCSINSTACRRYIYDTWYNTPAEQGGYGKNNGYGESLANWSIPAWLSAELTTATKNTIVSGNAGGNTCNASWSSCDHDDDAILNWFTPTNNQLWSNVTQGSVTSITDNKNNTITIKTSAGSNGSNNNISSETVHYKFSNGTTGSYARVNTKSNIPIPSGATSVDVWIVTVSQRQGSLTGTVKSADVKYYAAPTWPTGAKIWYVSKDIENNTKAKIKDDLVWHWTKAQAGNTNSPVLGYRVYLYKGTNKDDFVYRTADTDGNAIIITKPLSDTNQVIEAKYPADKTPYIALTAPSGKVPNNYFGFNPAEAGFKNKEFCLCQIEAFAKDGAGNELKSAKYLPRLNSSEDSAAYCQLFGGANIWIKTKSGTWKAAESVWIKTSTGTWKEAESVWIKTKAGTWKESS